MSDCNGSPCRDWIITLAQAGSMTIWGWIAIGAIIAAQTMIALVVIWLVRRLSKYP